LFKNKKKQIVILIVINILLLILLDIFLTKFYKAIISDKNNIVVKHPIYHHTFKSNSYKNQYFRENYTIFTNSLGFKSNKIESVDLKNCYAYSDSHHDIPLLEAVGNPRAINPDALLKIRAYRDNWPVYDFRRARRIKKLFGPMAGRVAALGSLISPRNLKRKG
jgi:hypothetical protein